jgi:hypothetical protein
LCEIGQIDPNSEPWQWWKDGGDGVCFRATCEDRLLAGENRYELPIHTSAVAAIRGVALQRVAEEVRVAGMLSTADAFARTCEERGVKIIPFGFSLPESV